MQILTSMPVHAIRTPIDGSVERIFLLNRLQVVQNLHFHRRVGEAILYVFCYSCRSHALRITTADVAGYRAEIGGLIA